MTELKKIPCPDCGGTGIDMRLIDLVPAATMPDVKGLPCLRCKGTGLLEVSGALDPN